MCIPAIQYAKEFKLLGVQVARDASISLEPIPFDTLPDSGGSFAMSYLPGSAALFTRHMSSLGISQRCPSDITS